MSELARPRAIIDIGSNSIRLVVYGGPERIPAVLFNEKVMAGLGRDLSTLGKLSDEALEAADRSSTVQRDRSPPLTGMSGHAWRTLGARTPERSQIDYVRVPSRLAKSPYRSGLRR